MSLPEVTVFKNRGITSLQKDMKELSKGKGLFMVHCVIVYSLRYICDHFKCSLNFISIPLHLDHHSFSSVDILVLSTCP